MNADSPKQSLGSLESESHKYRQCEKALAIHASMIGVSVLMRAVDDAELSEEALQSELASIAHTDPPSCVVFVGTICVISLPPLRIPGVANRHRAP